ncbi:hypothetical protein ILUMI_00718 [Ignelater luminosus]|uniref:DUF7869 domain-containing protein n=1 Tax=Ignelater luminosus TaxID=2038154 RepID=A0A8K0DL30_IGNLU|nr:hypothetical protein ILUMI_00718 [Ignelater luminosus]
MSLTNKHVESELYVNNIENFNLLNISENNTAIFKEIDEIVSGIKKELLCVSLHKINKTYSKILTEIIMKSENFTNYTVSEQGEVVCKEENVTPCLETDMSVNRSPSTVEVHHSNKLQGNNNACLWQKFSKMDLKLARRNFRSALQIPIDFNSLVIVLDTTKPGSYFKHPENKPKYRCSSTPFGKVPGKISLQMKSIDNQLISQEAYPYVDDHIELNDIQLTSELNEVYYKLADSNIFNSPNRTIILTDSNQNSPSGVCFLTYGRMCRSTYIRLDVERCVIATEDGICLSETQPQESNFVVEDVVYGEELVPITNEKIATNDGFCYFWTETDGKRGSDEIGTALFTYLKQLPNTVRHVSLYSDSCGSQNRNRFVACVLMHAVKTLPIEIIDQNFLKTGHTDMEVDSMHNAIEANKKHQRIYTPHGWPVILRTARRKHLYHVEELGFNDILDLKALKATLTVGKMSEDTEGNTINWMNIKML